MSLTGLKKWLTKKLHGLLFIIFAEDSYRLKTKKEIKYIWGFTQDKKDIISNSLLDLNELIEIESKIYSIDSMLKLSIIDSTTYYYTLQKSSNSLNFLLES